jgi:hypothetical protein
VLRSKRLRCHSVPPLECAMKGSSLGVAEQECNLADCQFGLGDVASGSFLTHLLKECLIGESLDGQSSLQGWS